MKNIQAAIILALRFGWSAEDLSRRFNWELADVLHWLVATRKLNKRDRCRDSKNSKQV
jgi:hypothetical protein